MRRSLAAALALVAAVVAIYSPALRGGFVWDDDNWVWDNPMMTAPGGLARMWTNPGDTPQYYPLSLTTFWLERRLYGLATPGYHAVNLLLHLATTAGVWRLLVRLRVPGAGLAAALFALHPVHVESVAWITERKNVLSGALALASACAYARFALSEQDRRERTWPWAAAALALHALALWSKTVVATLPFAMLLLVAWRRADPSRDLRPMPLVRALLGGVRARDAVYLGGMVALGLIAGSITAVLERHQVGASGPQWEFTAWERVLLASRAAMFYAAKLAWPSDLSFVYPRWDVRAGAAPFLASLAGVTAATWLAWTARRRFGLGPLVAWVCFLGIAFPALGFVSIYPMRYSFVADHFVYLASIPLLALAAATWARLAAPRLPRAAAVGVPALALAVLSFSSWSRAHAFGSEEALWRHTLRANPGAFLAHTNLGAILAQRGDAEEAKAHLEVSWRLAPDPTTADNLGLLLLRQGRPDLAEPWFVQAVQLDPKDIDGWLNLGDAAMQRGQRQQALAFYARALRLWPGHPRALRGLARAMAEPSEP